MKTRYPNVLFTSDCQLICLYVTPTSELVFTHCRSTSRVKSTSCPAKSSLEVPKIFAGFDVPAIVIVYTPPEADWLIPEGAKSVWFVMRLSFQFREVVPIVRL